MNPPTITIVTPSFNQGQFIERTIRSVLGQRYPRLEYIVMDGGSTDGSVEIIRRYEPWLTYWRSAKDDGQAGSILDGFDRGTGSILGYINSDDVLMEGALWRVAHHFERTDAAPVVGGDGIVIDADDRVIRVDWCVPPVLSSLLYFGCTFTQCGTFWTRAAFDEVGRFRRDFQFAFDFDLFVRFCRRFEVARIPAVLGGIRSHAATKTSTMQDVRVREDAIVRRREGVEGHSLRRRVIFDKWMLQIVLGNRVRNLRHRITDEAERARWNAWLAELRRDTPLG